MKWVGAAARGANGGAAVANWTVFVLWGNWWNAAVGGLSTLVLLFLLGMSMPRWWHGLFHMTEPCGLCGHTRKHNALGADWCDAERTLEEIAAVNPIYGVVTSETKCLCTRGRMNEHRKSEAGRQGSAGAAAFLAGGPINPYVNPYAAAGANQGGFLVPSGFQQAILKLQTIPTVVPTFAGYGISANPPALPEADWTDEAYTGYRAFLLYADAERGVFRLKSVTDFGTVWESDTLRAHCAVARTGGGPQPDDMSSHMGACSCGVYLCSEKEAVVRQVFAETLDQQGNQLVMGACAGWGTVIEHEGGMRVEYARIERLWTLSGKPELCDRLAGIYGVPCSNLWEMIK